MKTDDLAAYVRTITRQAVPAGADEAELLGLLASRYLWLEKAWQRASQRLHDLGVGLIPTDVSPRPPSADTNGKTGSKNGSTHDLAVGKDTRTTSTTGST